MPAIDPITVPVTMLVTNAAPLRAVTDALTDLATAIRNMLDDQAEPIPSDEALADMARRAYDGRYSKLCAHECADGTCADPGKTPQCGGCCDCLGGCQLGYEEQRAEATANGPSRDDIGAEVAECLFNYLEASLCGNGPSPDTTQDIVERILAACGVPADPELTIEPKPDAPIDLDGLWMAAIVQAARQRDSEPCQVCGGDRLRQDFTGSGRCHAARPVDLDSLGLGAVVRARIEEGPRMLWVRTPDGGLPWVCGAGNDWCSDAWWCATVDLTDVEVLHPGITIGGEDA